MDDDPISDDERAELDEVFAETGATTRPARRVIVDRHDAPDIGGPDVDEPDVDDPDVSSGTPREPRRRHLRGFLRRKNLMPAVQPAAKPAASRKVTTGPSGKKRVVISDDDSGPAPRPSGASKFRQRRIAVRRAAGRRRLRWFSVVGIAVVAILVVLLLLTSPILSIRSVNVEGNVYTDPTSLGEVIADLKGEPILTADLHGAEVRLLAIPWVRDVSISSHLPSSVTIQIVEREPIAFFRAVDGFNRVIDRDGRVLDVIEGDPVDYRPIRGTGPNLSAGETVGQPFLGAAQLMNALPTELSVRLIAMSVSAEGDVSMSLTNEVEVLFGPPQDFQAKLVGVVNEIKKQGSNKYATIDVSSGEPSVR